MSKNVNYIYTPLVLSNDINRGGNCKCLYIKKSPLGDLGVEQKKKAFKTPSFFFKKLQPVVSA